MKKYEIFELTFQGEGPESSWVEIDLQGTFSNGNMTNTVKGFYAGNGIYKIRFLPLEEGDYTWEIKGIFNERGSEKCLPNEAKKHGPVKAKGVHFYYSDGMLYRPFGTTVYALAHQDRQLMQTTMNTLKDSPFNKVRFCVFPKHYDFNHNEPDYYAFEKSGEGWNVHRPVFAFWDAFEHILSELNDCEIQADLILFHPYDRWGFSKLTREEARVYLDYLVRRFACFPNVWWSLANEFDLMEFISAEDFCFYEEYLAREDVVKHLISNHNCFDYWDFSRPNVTHCCIQDINVNEVPELIRKYGKPIVFDECRYEGNIQHNWGNISAKEMVHRFWTAMTYGGYCTHGETYYSADEILWWSRGGTLKGESAPRIQFLKTLFEEYTEPMEFVNEGVTSLTVEQVEEMKQNGLSEQWKDDFFAKGLIRMPRERMLSFMVRNRPCLGHIGNKVYLRYMEKECAIRTELVLPTERKYNIEVIDTWEMTRNMVAQGVNGNVTVALPGKEGMAVLAYAEDGKTI